MKEYRIKARVVGTMPYVDDIAEALWGEGIDYNSDGDVDLSGANWRELTLERRPEYDQRIDIDPIKGDRNVVTIRSESQDVLNRTFDFLASVGAVERLSD